MLPQRIAEAGHSAPRNFSPPLDLLLGFLHIVQEDQVHGDSVDMSGRMPEYQIHDFFGMRRQRTPRSTLRSPLSVYARLAPSCQCEPRPPLARRRGRSMDRSGRFHGPSRLLADAAKASVSSRRRLPRLTDPRAGYRHHFDQRRSQYKLLLVVYSVVWKTSAGMPGRCAGARMPVSSTV